MARAPGFARHPDHRVEVTRLAGLARARFADTLLAESRRAWLVAESGHTPVIYFPREDVRMEHLERTDHATHCPFKGDAGYWTLAAGGRRAENAAWSYESPFDEVASLAGAIAFYTDRVEVEAGGS